MKKSDSHNLKEIVHDLKTPITSIIGFIELLKKNSYDEKVTHEFYEIVSSEADRLLRMVNDMLYISKDQTCTSNEKCNISIEIHKYVKELSPIANKRNINIDIIMNSSNIYVSMPENKVARLLTNILENAIKYNKESGKIFIDVSQEKNEVIIRIKDTGVGIPMEDLEKIFDKYYRSNTSLNMGVEGAGLGLAIAKDIAESYNGHIKVTSQLGKSTEFLISLPISKVL